MLVSFNFNRVTARVRIVAQYKYRFKGALTGVYLPIYCDSGVSCRVNIEVAVAGKLELSII